MAHILRYFYFAPHHVFGLPGGFASLTPLPFVPVFPFPAKISSIVLHEEEKKAEVYLKPEEVSLAIGKGGMNIKLASMLTEYTIDVYRELDESAMDEDIYLDEFKDEIDEWVITAIKNIGLDTAKAVLNAPREMLIEKADLEENTVDDVLRVLRAEFEE